MSFQVYVTAAVEEIYGDIQRYDSADQADHVLAQIESVYQSLADHPERGVRPSELLDIGIREYREIFFKPYRIIYRVRTPDVLCT